VRGPEELSGKLSLVFGRRNAVMKSKRRWFVVAIGALLLVFGLGCLNYTEAEGLEHHRAQAILYNLPAPSQTIYLFGVASTAFGAGLMGFGLARTRCVE
jgi:hypothetical protein